MSDVEREDGSSKGRYVFRGADGAVAEMTYSKVGASQIIIDHTEVPDAFRGQGVGLKLVEQAVADARARPSSRSARSPRRSSANMPNGATS